MHRVELTFGADALTYKVAKTTRTYWLNFLSLATDLLEIPPKKLSLLAIWRELVRCVIKLLTTC